MNRRQIKKTARKFHLPEVELPARVSSRERLEFTRRIHRIEGHECRRKHDRIRDRAYREAGRIPPPDAP